MDLTTRVSTDTAGLVPTAQSGGITLQFEGAAPVVVLADPDRSAQIVANLIENALRYAAASQWS